MKSKITIDIDGEGQPFIKLSISTDHSDLRDKTLSRFKEKFGHDSNLLRIRGIMDVDPNIDHYRIDALTPEEAKKVNIAS